jgi:mRNA-degrading endonuclease RelE of RelBE toxin-antitoxin system
MGMKYNLILSHKFDKEFSRLEKKLQDRVVEGLKEIKENPFEGKPLKGKLKEMLS